MLTVAKRISFTGVAIFWLSSVTPGCQEQEQPLIKIDTSLVTVEVIVLSKKTKTVLGDLKREDFTLQEHGKQQEITYFSREELPLSVVLLVDVTAASTRVSMKEVQRAALDALARLKPEDKVALMIFGSKHGLIEELTEDHARIANEMDDIWGRSAGVGLNTSIERGISEAARYLRQKTELSGRRAIVLITDDNSPQRARAGSPLSEATLKELDESDTALCGILATSSKDPHKEVRTAMVATSAVANPFCAVPMILFGILSRHGSGGGGASYYAERTGGVAIRANGALVGRVFVEMMEMLRARYTLGYRPPVSPADGKLREIKLTVNTRIQQEQGELLILT